MGPRWTNEYVQAATSAARKKKERWRHSQIKSALKVETDARCAYCEGYVDDVSYPHVEHLIPKGPRPDLAHVWGNLTSACGRCNVEKNDYYDVSAPILNPYVDEPDEHLTFLGHLIRWRPGSALGERTVRRVRLMRPELQASRLTRLEAVGALVDRWTTLIEPDKSIIADAIRTDVSAGEFSTAARAFVQALGFPM
jgi:uncharacterized protein (TIGR02646 family)